ncbi:MAG: transcriptional repressor LexA [Lachnospiraceae bacterium]|nr:transcriptional repressor LexA [Lachnospiraceae bacterium]
MPNGKITDKQREILKYMESETMLKGYPPSVREICQAVHLKSTSSVHAHLNSLEKNGYIRRDPTHPRAIEILDDSFQMVRTETVPVPVVGRVAAGEPILAEENIESYFPIPAEYLPKTDADMFCLEVRGDSMIDAGILDHDLLIVEARPDAKNGDVVVAMVGDSATVKTFYKEKGHYRLQPHNSAMEPIITDEVEILGKVRSLFRPSVF